MVKSNYATGSFLDEVSYTGTDAASATIKSFGAVSAFVAKVSKDGKFEAMKTFEPAGNMEIVLSEFPFYLPDEDPIDITPNNIQVDGDKVYVSATYKGDVEEIGWKGAYAVNYDFGMYFDNASAGVFSLNKSDLSGAANVAYVQATGTISETQNYPEALNFVVDNGTAYVGFFGFGNLTITTPAGSKDFTFASDGEGMNEETKQRLFENFFTTKPVGQGTGLGMTITRDIIENKHGGKLTFDSKEGEGTTFTFTIPIKK